MDVLSFHTARQKVEHPGTHNGHPLSAVAGSATLDLLADGTELARTNAVAAALWKRKCTCTICASRPIRQTSRPTPNTLGQD